VDLGPSLELLIPPRRYLVRPKWPRSPEISALDIWGLWGEWRGEVRNMMVAEVVGFDDEGHMDLGWKGFLQSFEEGLDEVPLGAPHVDDDSEATFANVLTVGRSEIRYGHSGQLRL
jgi:hypothetical protein